jgi:type I restriction enzyme, S subunit
VPPSVSGIKLAPLGRLVDLATGKLDSNAAVPEGAYPFFTCSRQTLRTSTYSFDCECVLLAGNNAAGVYPVKYFSGRFDAYQRTYVIRSTDDRVLNNRYMYYALQPKLEFLQRVSTGATTKFLTLSILKNIALELPPILAQERIAAILCAYDDLIENNSRRIQILEDMAQAIYREWFVEFRFPGHEDVRLVDSELGLIPEGWAGRALRDVVLLVSRGVSPKYEDKAVARVVNQKCVRGGSLSLDLARRHNTAVPPQKQLEVGDVLINSTGTGTLGRVAQVLSSLPNTTVDSHVSIVRPDPAQISHDYLGLNLLSREQEFASMATGSTGQTELSRSRIGDLRVLVPPLDIQLRFSDLVSPMRALSVTLRAEITNLRETRDLLLPRLISGEIDVSRLDIGNAEPAA